jgi:hypothetical protein
MRVADVDREEHGAIVSQPSPERGMEGDAARARIEAAMSTLATELPLSPELVLVSSPEVASLARQLLPDPEPAARLTAAAPRARASSVGPAAFLAFALANSLTPFVVAALAAG